MECIDVGRGRGVWLSGPLRLLVEKGSVLATGFTVEPGSELVVRAGRGASLYALEDSRVCIGLGSGGSYRVIGVEGFRLVASWQRVVEELRGIGAKRVIVVGGVEAGKSTLTAWIHNVLGLCVIEADIGQNELGTPGMVSFSDSAERVLSLQDLPLSGGFFVGHVSAEKVMDLVIAASLRASRRCSEYVMDTDGFIGSRGVVYKRALIEAVEPDAALVLGPKRLAEEIRGNGVEVLEAQPVPEELLRLRSRGDRRAYRQRLYASLFAGSKPIVLRDIVVEHLCPYTVSSDGVLYTCSREGFMESRRRPEPPLRWLRPKWAHGLLAALRSSKGDVLALLEDMDIAQGKVVVRPAKNMEYKGASAVVLGWIRLREDYSEEHLVPAPYPEALTLRRKRPEK